MTPSSQTHNNSKLSPSPSLPHQKLTKSQHEYLRHKLFQRTLFQDFTKSRGNGRDNVSGTDAANVANQEAEQARSTRGSPCTTLDTSPGNRIENLLSALNPWSSTAPTTDKKQHSSTTKSRNHLPSLSFLHRMHYLIFPRQVFTMDLHEKSLHERILLHKLWSMGLVGLSSSGKHAIAWNLISIFSPKKYHSDQKRNAFVNALGSHNEDQFFSYDPKAYIRLVHANLLMTMFALCESARVLFNYSVKTENEPYIDVIFTEFENLHLRYRQSHHGVALFPPHNYRLDISVIVCLRQLWTSEPAVRAAFKRAHEIQLPQNVTVCPNFPYYMWRLSQIAHPGYVPSSRDIFNLPLGSHFFRRRFHSHVPPDMLLRYRKDIRFINHPMLSFHLLEHSYFHGIDVPFQLVMPSQVESVNRFIHSFNFIIYTVDLTAYAQPSLKSPGGHRTKLHDTLDHLEEVVSRAPSNTPVYLFFTNLDLFMQTARSFDFNIHDPERSEELAHLHSPVVSWHMRTQGFNANTNLLQVNFNYRTKQLDQRIVESPRVTERRYAQRKLEDEFGATDETLPEFPTEKSVLIHIFQYLDAQSLVRVGRTNYRNYTVSSLDPLWESLCKQHNPQLTHYDVKKMYKQYLRPSKRKGKKRVLPLPNLYWKKMYSTNGYAKFKYLEHITQLVSRVVSRAEKCDLRGTFCITVGNEKLLRKAVSAVMVDFMQLQLDRELLKK